MKRNKKKKEIILLCAFFIASLSACTTQKSVVTRDSLQPNSNVQAALEQQAGGGKNYNYVWFAEDIDRAIEEYRNSYKQDLEQFNESIQSGDLSAKQEYESFQKEMEQELACAREELEKERLLDPVVSAQEAANLAGLVLEKNYGIDLSQKELRLSCMKIHVNGIDRLQWHAVLDEEADGSLFSSCTADVTLDATTGELVTAEYYPSYEEYQSISSSLPECYQPTDDPDALGVYGFYKVDDPAFDEFKQKVSEQIHNALSQSVLANGANVSGIEICAVDGAVKNETLSISVTYDNGNTALLTSTRPSVNYDFGGYPLRGYQYENTSYYNS